MTVLTFLYVLASFRTNITLVITFFFIMMAFFMLMSAYWTAAEGKTAISHDLQIVCVTYNSFITTLLTMPIVQAAGAFVFTFCMSGWYLWFSLIMSALDFPFELPLGDLSKKFPSMTDRQRQKFEREGESEKQTNGHADA